MTSTGLTTTKAPFIEEAKAQGQLYIDQPYQLYSSENHQTWKSLYKRILPRWEKYAHSKFLEGLNRVALVKDRIPRLEEINQFLAPLSGFKAKAVSGYVPVYIFFEALRQREFPTTITIRDGGSLDYLPEPDIFHDAAGHVPMHTDLRFADTLVRLGEVAKRAAQHAQEIKDPEQRILAIGNIVKAMARFFWFTVEFGLMHDRGQVKVYGSGLLSSFSELAHSIESPEVQRYPFKLEWVVNQYFEIHHFQPLLFIVDSFDHLYGLVDELEDWIIKGRLNNISPGEPYINEQDLKLFLEASL